MTGGKLTSPQLLTAPMDNSNPLRAYMQIEDPSKHDNRILQVSLSLPLIRIAVKYATTCFQK